LKHVYFLLFKAEYTLILKLMNYTVSFGKDPKRSR